MEGTFTAKVSALSLLFLTAALLVGLSAGVGTAQNSSTVNLEGTSWQGEWQGNTGVSLDTLTIQFKYVFTENRKLKASYHFQQSGYEHKQQYDAYTRRYETVSVFNPSKLSYGLDEDCTYQLDGRSIHIKCGTKGHERYIDGTIQGNRMEGEFYPLANEQKAKWLIKRILTAPADRPLFVFPVPANSPLLGTWKSVESSDRGTVSSTIILVYSQNGVVESTIQNTKVMGNWKYTPGNVSSGVLEEYREDDLIESGSVKWRGSNQFEYTVTFSQDPNAVGTRFVFRRQ